MGAYHATVSWTLEGESFLDQRYSRGHEGSFDGGAVVPASASPHIVPLPHSVAENVDPEEAYVASLSSCHMLFFLSLAAEAGIVVEDYRDEAVGYLEKTGDGYAMTRVVLRPAATYGGDRQPTAEEVAELHHRAHEQCFIANSVRSVITTDIRS